MSSRNAVRTRAVSAPAVSTHREARTRVAAGPDEQGMVSAFVVGVVFSLLLSVGLVYDGGSILVTRRTADNLAATAARAGAQALDVDELYRTGIVVLDQGGAEAAARGSVPVGEMDAVDAVEVVVRDTTVAVVVVMHHDLSVLGAGGLAGPVEVRGRATARLASGVGGVE